MKVLIWIGFFIVHYILTNIINVMGKTIQYIILQQGDTITDGMAIGYGTIIGILTAASFGICFWGAKKLCNKWDEKQGKPHKEKQTYTCSCGYISNNEFDICPFCGTNQAKEQ